MDILQSGLLSLIRSAITREPAALPEGFQLEDALTQITRHQITGIVYEGAVKCGVSPRDEAMQKLFQRYYANLIHSEKQLKTLEKLFQAFQENGIDHLPLKGTMLKALYPQSAMRVMGDADILIRMEQYDTIKPVMESLGFEEKAVSGHEWIWTHPSLYLELHKYMMPSKIPDFFRYFENGWQRAIPEQGCRYTLRTEDHFIFLFVHYAKHYRGGGIGLRQLTDLWVFQRAYPQMDLSYVRKELSDLKLLEFFDNTQRMLNAWFDGGQLDDKAAFMSDFIWNSGSWGSKDTRQISQGVKAEHLAGSRSAGWRKYVTEVLFPPVRILKRRYPVLEKAPWLLPFLWPVRWVTALLFRHKNIQNYQRILQNRSASKIDAYEQALNFVGLDFDF